MLQYLIFVLLLLIGLYSKIPNFFMFILLFLFSGLRKGIGWDYYSYYEIIERVINGSFDHNYLRFSKFWKILINFAAFLKTPQFFIIMTSFLIILYIYLGVKNNGNKTKFSMIIYALFPMFYLNGMSTIRQALAVSIVFYGTRFLLEKKIFKWILWIMFATYVHTTAIVGFLFYIIYYFPIKKSKIIFFVFSFLIIFQKILINIIKYIVLNYIPEYSYYINNYNDNFGQKLMVLYAVIGFFFLIIRDRMIVKNKLNQIYIDIYLYGVVLMIILGSLNGVLMRGSNYFLIFLIKILPDVSIIFKNNNRKVLKILILVTMIITFFGYLTLIKDVENKKARYVPYRTIFQE